MRNYWIDGNLRNTMIALLKEVVANGDDCPDETAPLVNWYLASSDLIEATIQELECLEPENG